MDQSVIETFKRHCRKNLLRQLLFADDSDVGGLQFYKKLNLKDCIYMLSDAWENEQIPFLIESGINYVVIMKIMSVKLKLMRN